MQYTYKQVHDCLRVLLLVLWEFNIISSSVHLVQQVLWVLTIIIHVNIPTMVTSPDMPIAMSDYIQPVEMNDIAYVGE